MQNIELLTEVKYYFYSLTFKPFADKKETHNNHTIGKEIFFYLANIKNQGEAILIDRNEKKEKHPKRELFLSVATIIPNDRIVRYTMALIRKGKRPKLKKKGTFRLEDLNALGDIVEVTHFFVDYSTDHNIICVEQNHNGPNIADIEYYLKYIGRETLTIARTADLTIHMLDNIENTMEKMKNVLSFNIKIRPSNLDLINTELSKNFFSGFDIVSTIYKPEFLRIEAFFKKQGRKIKKRKENKIATNMFSKALSIFKTDPQETDYYDQFDVVFEDGKGNEDTFNLLKNKKVAIKLIPNNKELTVRESYELVKDDIKNFVNEIK